MAKAPQVRMGQTVHYVPEDSTLFTLEPGELPAVVVSIDNRETMSCTLNVFRRVGAVVSMPWVKYDPTRKPGTWHFED